MPSDCRGQEIRVGQRVVYNRSGDLAVGVVTDMKERQTCTDYGYKRIIYRIKVRRIDPQPEVRSIVTNPKGILVLNDAPH